MSGRVPAPECVVCGTMIFCGDNARLAGGPACPPCGGSHWLCGACNVEWDLFDDATCAWRLCPEGDEFVLMAELMGWDLAVHEEDLYL